LLELFEPVVALLSWNSERKEKERELNRASAVRQGLARSLQGTVTRPWIGSPRVTGRMGPADVEVVDLGEGKVDLILRVPFKAEFTLEAAGFFRRLTSDDEPVLRGEASPEARRLAASLLRRFQGEVLRVTPGRLELRATPGLDRHAILDLIDGASELLEELI
jgi:hypothetical protein